MFSDTKLQTSIQLHLGYTLAHALGILKNQYPHNAPKIKYNSFYELDKFIVPTVSF